MSKTPLFVPVALCLVLGSPSPGRPLPIPQDPPAAAPVTPVERALAEFRAGRLDEALGVLEDAGAAEGEDPRATAVLGALYVEAERHEDALRVLTPLADTDNADVGVLYNAGRAAAALGQKARAQRYLEGSVAGFPGSPAVRELGMLHLREERFMPAYLSLAPWCRSHPDDVEAALAAARCAIALGRGEEAERLLENVPNDTPAVKLLWANALLLGGDAWSALAVAKELAESPPEGLEPQVLILLADVYFEIGDPGLVVEALTGKTDRRPLVAVRLARALRLEGRLDEALELLTPFSRGLIESDPQVGSWLPGLGAEVALEQGRLLAAAGRHSEAIPFLRASAERAGQKPDVWRALGRSLEVAGEMAESREAIARADQIERVLGSEPAEPGDGVLLGSDATARQLRRAQALLELGATEEGLRVARQEKVLAPADPRPRLVEALLLMELQRREEALTAIEAAQADFPANADIHYYRGVVDLSLERLPEAEEALRRAIELAPQHTPALTDLATLLVRLDRRDEAGELVERILAISPEDSVAAELRREIDG